MIITKIIASAQAGFNHPFEQYANFKPSITLEAIVEVGENPDDATRALQLKAQNFVDQERGRIEARCQREQDIDGAESDLERFESCIASYENILATYPERISTNPDGWETVSLKATLERAPADLEKARADLAIARAKLAALKPELLPVVISNKDRVEQVRCTLGEFISCNPAYLTRDEDAQHIADKIRQAGEWVLKIADGSSLIVALEKAAA